MGCKHQTLPQYARRGSQISTTLLADPPTLSLISIYITLRPNINATTTYYIIFYYLLDHSQPISEFHIQKLFGNNGSLICNAIHLGKPFDPCSFKQVYQGKPVSNYSHQLCVTCAKKYQQHASALHGKGNEMLPHCEKKKKSYLLLLLLFIICVSSAVLHFCLESLGFRYFLCFVVFVSSHVILIPWALCLNNFQVFLKYGE